jgi:hypothetical protein
MLRPLLCCLVVSLVLVGPSGAKAEGPVQVSQISGDPDKPRRHFRVRQPARLDPARAEELYQGLVAELAEGYAKSGLSLAEDYQSWPRYNSAPYLSMTHGNTYINNYVNALGSAYGRFEAAGTLPVGTVIAKDSVIVARNGEVRPGALFVMEKMPEGFNYVSGDWRYSMIMPDGVLFGETHGEDSERVEYCIGCHLAVEKQDHLFFIPPEYRVQP